MRLLATVKWVRIRLPGIDTIFFAHTTTAEAIGDGRPHEEEALPPTLCEARCKLHALLNPVPWKRRAIEAAREYRAVAEW